MGVIDEINNLSLRNVVKTLGYTCGRMRSLSPCPSCGANKRGSSDPRGPIALNRDDHYWTCYACEAHGDVVEFLSQHKYQKKTKEISNEEISSLKELLGGGRSLLNDSSFPHASLQSVSNIVQKPKPRSPSVSSGGFKWKKDLWMTCRENLFTDQGSEVLDYLCKYRRISEETVRFWELGAHFVYEGGKIVEKWVSIPLKNEVGVVVNVRFRRIPTQCVCGAKSDCKRCKGTGVVKKGYRVCANRPMPLFGSHLLGADRDTTIYVTEGEFDAIAMYEYGFTNSVVSGTTGAGANWPDEWLDMLEPYKNFILIYDDDEAGQTGATRLADKLGGYRTSSAMLPYKDANECLINAVSCDEIKRCIGRASSMMNVTLRRVNDYEKDLDNLINNPDRLVGRDLGSKKLERALGGMRPGLWVLTGETGHGKTTFATWLLREQSLLGAPTMLTSFEQRPIGTVQKLLRAQLGGDFMQCSVADRKRALEELGQLPIYILDHYGEATKDYVIDSIRYARRRHDVRVALIDHLGFLARGSGDKERQVIEEIVRSLALVAVNDGITILLVCHPNRAFTSQQRRVRISDLKGASAIEQDAHVGIVVQRQEPDPRVGFPCAMVYVDKVRSEFGSPGSSFMMPFDPLSCVFADTWDETPSGKRGVKIVVEPE